MRQLVVNLCSLSEIIDCAMSGGDAAAMQKKPADAVRTSFIAMIRKDFDASRSLCRPVAVASALALNQSEVGCMLQDVSRCGDALLVAPGVLAGAQQATARS